MVFQLEHPTAKDTIRSLEQWIFSLPIYHSFDELPFHIDLKDIKKAEEVLKVSTEK